MISTQIEKSLQNSSAIRKMFEEGIRLAKIHGAENVYDFSLGNPDMPPPQKLIDALKEYAGMEGIHRYMPNAGFVDVREKIAEKVSSRGKKVTANHIVMTVGAAGGLNVCFKSLLNQGDEVIVLAPYFVEYNFYITNHGGVPVVVQTNDDFSLNLENISNAITAKTKALIINSPNNPTGVVYSKDELTALADVLYAKQKEFGTDICILSDEPYQEISFEKEVPNLLDIYDNSLIVNSFSKSLSLPGARLGYIAMNPDIKDADKVMSALTLTNRTLGFVNAPALYQKAVAASLDATVDVEGYKERRDALYEILIEAGFKAYKPEGAFYFFIESPLDNDKEFVEMATKHHLLFAPGSGFGRSGYFRICYCVSLDKIKRSRDAFIALGKELGLK
jgi:aspartate aminotransferase